MTCLCWGSSVSDPPTLVVGTAAGSVQVWVLAPEARQWARAAVLHGHTGRVADLAWAPNTGRSYNLLVTGGEDGRTVVWRLSSTLALWDLLEGRPAASATGGGEAATSLMQDGVRWWCALTPPPRAPLSVSPLAVFVDHGNAPVWRVEWNLTGTVVASGGEDGRFHVRRQGAGGAWNSAVSLDAAALAAQAANAAGGGGTAAAPGDVAAGGPASAASSAAARASPHSSSGVSHGLTGALRAAGTPALRSIAVATPHLAGSHGGGVGGHASPQTSAAHPAAAPPAALSTTPALPPVAPGSSVLSAIRSFAFGPPAPAPAPASGTG